MKIDRQLNLVKTIESDTGTYHIHSVPIPRAVWEDNFYIISQAYNAIFTGGIAGTGPKMAGLMLKRCAKQFGEEDGYAGLMSEIWRLTNVTFQNAGAWHTMPFEAVRSTFDEEAIAEAENAIVFFYLRLCGPAGEGGETKARRDAWCDADLVGCADYALGLYGVRRFLADIDAGRSFFREEAGIVSDLLDWVATEGFETCVGQHAKPKCLDAHHWRQRYLMRG